MLEILQGHAWVRTSIRRDVLHRQNAGYSVPPLPKEISDVEDTDCIDSQPESSFPWSSVL